MYKRRLEDIHNTRFDNSEKFRKDLILFENPFTVQIEEQNLEFQAELCDL